MHISLHLPRDNLRQIRKIATFRKIATLRFTKKRNITKKRDFTEKMLLVINESRFYAILRNVYSTFTQLLRALNTAFAYYAAKDKLL